MRADIQIPAFTATCLLVTAILCVVSVLVAWYTVRDRVKFSQIILGLFCYVLVMLLESLMSLLQTGLSIPADGLAYGVYTVLSVVAAREIVRFAAMRFGVRSNFDGADAAIGFALGFAGLYLFICGAYYFNLYTAAREFISGGMQAFLASSGSDADDALQLLETIASQHDWQYVATGVNRVFYLLREMALCLMLWYAMEDGGKRLWLIPALHLIAMVPEGLYQAGLLENSYVRDAATVVLSGGIAFLGARQYNAREDQAAHYQADRLRARRRR